MMTQEEFQARQFELSGRFDSIEAQLRTIRQSWSQDLQAIIDKRRAPADLAEPARAAFVGLTNAVTALETGMSDFLAAAESP